jgi:hypothetical protein
MASGGPEDASASEIEDDAEVLLWVGVDHYPKVVGRPRPNGSLFEPSSDGSGASAVLARSDEERAVTVATRSEFKWVRLSVGDVRACEPLDVEWQDDPDVERHVGIVGWPSSRNARVRLKRELANRCEWIGEPPPILGDRG